MTIQKILKASRVAVVVLGIGGGYTLCAQDSGGPTAPANTSAADHPGFFGRFLKAYADDWKGTPAPSGPEPAYRGDPAPVSGPPFPFGVWPYGGSVTIGQPWTQSGPLMQAIWGGKHGDWWKRSGIQIYGYLNGGVT